MPGLPSSGKSELSPSPPAILVISSRLVFFMLMRILLRSASFTPKPDEENPSDELARSHEENERSIVHREYTTHSQDNSTQFPFISDGRATFGSPTGARFREGAKPKPLKTPRKATCALDARRRPGRQ